MVVTRRRSLVVQVVSPVEKKAQSPKKARKRKSDVSELSQDLPPVSEKRKGRQSATTASSRNENKKDPLTDLGGLHVVDKSKKYSVQELKEEIRMDCHNAEEAVKQGDRLSEESPLQERRHGGPNRKLKGKMHNVVENGSVEENNYVDHNESEANSQSSSTASGPKQKGKRRRGSLLSVEDVKMSGNLPEEDKKPRREQETVVGKKKRGKSLKRDLEGVADSVNSEVKTASIDLNIIKKEDDGEDEMELFGNSSDDDDMKDGSQSKLKNKTADKKKPKIEDTKSYDSSSTFGLRGKNAKREKGHHTGFDSKNVSMKKCPPSSTLCEGEELSEEHKQSNVQKSDISTKKQSKRGKKKKELEEVASYSEDNMNDKPLEHSNKLKDMDSPTEGAVDGGSDYWEYFGDSGDDSNADEVDPKLRKKKGKTGTGKKILAKQSKKDSAVRRSRRNVPRKNYVVDLDIGEEVSSSSSAAEDSDSGNDSVAEATVSQSVSEEEVSSENEEGSNNSDASFSMVPSKHSSGRSEEKKVAGKGVRKVPTKERKRGSSSTAKSGASKSSSKASKIPAPKALPSKPPKPWQKTSTTVVEGDIIVPPRQFRKGERKMLKFSAIAAGLSIGRNFEMTQEESCQILDQMRAQTAAVRAAVPETTTKNSEDSAEDGSSSEDEWEEMELVDRDDPQGKNVQVTLKKEEEKDWWALYLRQEVNKCVRQNWENAHKVHFLCYIAHLLYLKKVVLEEGLVPSLMLTKMPSGYQNLVGRSMSIDLARKMVKWYQSAFKASGAPIKYDTALCRYDATARLSEMVAQQVFENDADRAASVMKDIEKMRKKPALSAPAPTDLSSQKVKAVSKKKTSSVDDYKGTIRNYWVEYWDKKQKRWICVDPLRAEVDNPTSLEENLTKPVVYVLVIDNDGGVREVAARYASDYSRPDFRKRRTDQGWVVATLKKSIIRADRNRAQLEEMQLRQDLVNKPLPTTLSEYKNHPLYVLEKDLLKFEGIYPRPEDQKPLGEVRGHKVYPRSTVYTLQSALNWVKMARSVKEGEKPYKVVKARPNMRVPVEERVERFLDVFGYWQTEPFRPPKVENGRIPRNDFGNVYMYQPAMCPIGAVHLRLPGLPSIARRLGGLECVPAVVGWEFNSCTNFPILEGACVLEQDAEKFIKEYKRLEATREQRENKRREERVLGNWKRLIRGILRLHYVRKKFGATKRKDKVSRGKQKKEGKEASEQKEESEPNSQVIDRTVMGPRQVFTHDDMMKLKR